MSVLIDSFTLVFSVVVMLWYSKWVVKSPKNKYALLGLTISALYVYAQTGWTVAFLSGDVWGRDLSNYIWFVFNSCVFVLLTIIAMEKTNDT